MTGLLARARRWNDARWHGFGLADGGLALALTIVAQGEAWAHTDMGPPVLIAALLLVGTGSLAWRRRAPLATAVAVTASMLTLGIWDVPDILATPSITFIVAIYSCGSNLPLRQALVGAAVVLVPIAVMLVFVEDTPADLVFLGGVFGGVWVVGRVVRSRRALTMELADRNVLLERERDEKARLAVAEERTRIARELHDVVAHCVNLIVVQAAAERRALGDDAGGETAAVLGSIETTGREALTEMRRLLGILRRDDESAPLAPPASLRELDALVDQVRAAGLPVELHVGGERRPLPPGVDLSAYRIVQEALTNTLKHAGPARADVRVVQGARELELIVTDDGTLAGPRNGSGAGQGLIGMRERVALFGGSLDAGPRAGGGFRVHARLPLGPPAA